MQGTEFIKQAHILAGGKSSRFGLQSFPKSLAPLSATGKPALGFLLDSLLLAGVDRLIITLPAHQSGSDWHDSIKRFVAIGYADKFDSIEFTLAAESIHATILSCEALYDPSFFLLGSDILTDLDFEQLARHHAKGYLLTIATVQKCGASLESFGMVSQINGRTAYMPKNSHTAASGQVDTGIYAIDRRFIDQLKAADVYHQAINHACKLQLASPYCHPGHCFNINTPQDYQQAKLFLSGRQK